MDLKKLTKQELIGGLETALKKNERLKKKSDRLSTELKETKQLYHSLVDLSPEAIILHDEGIITYANEATVKLFGVESNKYFIGRHVLELVPPDYRETIQERIKRNDESFRLEPFFIKAKRNDGVEFYLESLASSVQTGKGKSVQVIIRDITKQKKTELELRKANRALEAMSAINQTLIRAESEEQFLSESCRILCETGGYIMTWIGYIQEDTEKTVKPAAWYGVEEGYLNLVKITADDGPFSQGPVGRALKAGHSFIVHNIENEWDNKLWIEAARKRGYSSIISLPLLQDKSILGSITIYSENVNSFDKEETSLLERLADDISFGISALRSKSEKEKTEQFLIESEDRYRSLVELSPEAIIVHSEGRIMYANHSTLKYLCASNREELIGQSMADLVPAEYKDEIHSRMEKSRENPSYAEPLEMKFNSPDGKAIYLEAVGAPVKYLGKPAGQVIIRDITARKLYEEELKESREQMRSLAAHLREAREEERTRVAREIHDELGQYLTGLKMDISLLREMIEESGEKINKPVLLEKIASASGLLDTTVRSVRKLSSDLRPAVLDNLGLCAAIEWQADEFQNRMGIRCDCFLTEDELEIPSEYMTDIFRIFQESLTNVAKHSKATRVSIELRKENNYYILEIKDNGIGISEEDKLKLNSFGLLGIKERTLLFGGSAEITGLPGKGTKVSVKIPL